MLFLHSFLLRSTTTFHPQAGRVLQDILPDLEQWSKQYSSNAGTTTISSPTAAAINSLQSIEQSIHAAIRSLVGNRQILRGFPLNMTYTDAEEVVTKVKTLAVHESRHPAVQFVLSVKAVPLFNNIVSLWLFIGSLEAPNPSTLR